MKKTETKTAMEIHKDLCVDIHSMCVKKNHDYGDSAHKIYEEYGLNSYLIRMSDKMSRIKTLIRTEEQQVKDESIIDSLKDLANYALLATIDVIQYPEMIKEGKHN